MSDIEVLTKKCEARNANACAEALINYSRKIMEYEISNPRPKVSYLKRKWNSLTNKLKRIIDIIRDRDEYN